MPGQSDERTPTASAEGGRKPNVLVVEDNPWVALSIADEVEDLGCVVIGPAATLGDALTLARGKGLDAALVDIMLAGGKNAYPLAHVLTDHGVPFAFITGKGERPDVPFENVPVLQKPFGSAKLRRAVAEVLSVKGNTTT